MIIGIHGRIKSGKDTTGKVSQYLISESTIKNKDQYPLSFDKFVELEYDVAPGYCDWVIKKFAGKLKECISIITGIPLADLEKEEIKESYLDSSWTMPSHFIVEHDVDGTIITNNFDGTIDELLKEYLPEYREPYISEYKSIFNNKGKAIIFDYEATYVPAKRITVRELLQTLGTEVGRLIHPNFWVNGLFADYDINWDKQKDDYFRAFPDSYNYPNWIITDLRFPNEFEAIKERGGITIKVIRDVPCSVCKLTQAERRGKPCNEIACPNGSKEHSSETALDNAKFDYYIDNNGTIEELIAQVKEILIKEKLLGYENT